jgi:AcrR family transcriptional regulator
MTTKDKILSVVVSYIKLGKINQLSTSQIALEAEVGKSTLYEYFKNKDEMIIETYKYLIHQYECILLKPLKETTYKKMLIEELSQILTVMTEATHLMQTIMSHGQMQLSEIPMCLESSMVSMKKKLDERFKIIFDQGILEKEIKSINPHPYLRNMIQAIMTGLMIQYVHKEIEIDEEGLLELIFEQIENLINT